MKLQLLALYQLIEDSANSFIENGLMPIAFIDTYRTQVLEPEKYEAYPVPAIFVDYKITGKGIKKPRLVSLYLHIITDDNIVNGSSISPDKNKGLNHYLYCSLIQQIIEAKTLSGSGKIKFIQEGIVDSPVVNYHTQEYEFECYLESMIKIEEKIEGYFETFTQEGALK